MQQQDEQLTMCVGGNRGCRMRKTCKRAISVPVDHLPISNFHNPAEKLCDHYLAVTIGGRDE